MFKRVMMICLLGVSLAVMRGSEVKAHLAGTVKIGGYLRHVASLNCGTTVKGVPNPDTKPSLFQCTATITAVEFLCQNPQNKTVSGTSRRRTVLVGEAPFDAANIDKNKGTGTAEVHLETGVVVTDADCVNPNWHVLPDTVIVKETTVQFDTLECGLGSDATNCFPPLVKAYTETKSCVLPPGFGFGKNETFPPEDTGYFCTLLSSEHLR